MSDHLSRVLHLSRSLAPVISPENERPGHGTMRSERVARAIIADPQEHIDALVEAGVLEKASVVTYVNNPNGIGQTNSPGYRVVAPHEHDWYAAENGVTNRTRTVRLRCNDNQCHETREVVNRLPIEIPS